MPGRGPAPKPTSRTRHKPIRGEWKPAPGSGWRHGPVPAPPDGLRDATRVAWQTWMTSWYAAHWTPEYLPQLYATVRLFDAMERGDLTRAAELRQWMDGLGITFKGQQDRRWAPPIADAPAAADTTPAANPYAHLRVVNE